jgi:hypothetical protein
VVAGLEDDRDGLLGKHALRGTAVGALACTELKQYPSPPLCHCLFGLWLLALDPVTTQAFRFVEGVVGAV